MEYPSSVRLDLAASRTPTIVAQFLGIFLGIPLLVYEHVLPAWPIALLMAVGGWATWSLWRDPTVDLRSRFRWNLSALEWRTVLLRDALLIGVLAGAVWYAEPELLFSFVRKAPWQWALVMILYPLLSVLPQELLFRVYFFQRYSSVFGRGVSLMAVNALSFAFVHIIFGNWIAVGLSGIGGVLFASTYDKSRSLLLVSLEHAVFGNFLFTIGLGQYFNHLGQF
jgi:uncharacterized protein